MDGITTATGIGQPVRRREDLRLITGGGRYSDDLNLPGQAYAVMVRSPLRPCPDPLARNRSGRRDAGRARGPDLGGRAAGWAEPDAAHRQFPPRRHLDQEQGRHADRPSAASADRFPGSLPCRRDRRGRRRDQPRCRQGRRRTGRRSIGSRCPPSPAPAMLPNPMRRAPGRTAPTSSSTEKSATRRQRQRRSLPPPMSSNSTPGCSASLACRWSRAPRSASTTRRPACYTLHAGAGGAVSPRRDLAMVLGVPPEQVRMVMHDIGGNFGTRGSLNVEFALVVWAAKRLGRPVKWTSERSEYFVADYQARDLTCHRRTGARQGRHVSRDARLEPGQPGRLCDCLRLAQQGRRDHVEHLPCAGRAFPRTRGADQYVADPALSQLGPARGHVRHRAADRSRGPADRHRPHRIAPPQPRAGTRDAVHQPVRHGLRQRRVSRRSWSGCCGWATGRASRPAAPKPRRAAGAAASASPTMSTPRPARRAKRPR